jgi:hypothetical protein
MEAKESKTGTPGKFLIMPKTGSRHYMLKSPAATPTRKRRAVARAKGKDQLLRMLSAEIKLDTYDALNTYDNAGLTRLAKAMTRILPADPHPEEKMAAKVGPFYETATLVDWLGVTKQALSKRAAKRELLAVQDSAGRNYYPDRQFTEDGTVIPGLREVLDTLAAGTQTPWTWALWLAGTSKALSGQTAWDALRNGDADQVLQAARRDSARWAE